jgi:hypothetical protein
MSSNILSQYHREVNQTTPKNFVPAKAPVAADTDEYTQGRRMYYHGKPLAACLTDEQARGWTDAEARCEAQYWGGMMAQASMQEAM